MKINRRASEKGVLTIAFAFMAVVLIGFTGLAIDVGYLQWQKRGIQGAADAAAMGALREMERNQTDLAAAGQNDAAMNGFVNGQNNTTITINNPPTSGSYSGNVVAVEAIVTKRVPTFFMMIFGQTGVNVSARAVARTTSSEGSIGACIFVLNPTQKAALEIGGTSMNLSTQCGVVVNSTDSAAFKMDSGVQFTLGNNAKVGVVGGGAGDGWSINGQSSLIDANNNNAPEQPVNIQAFNDPLAGVKGPTAATVTGGVQGNNFKVDQTHMPTGNVQPGVYCGGISVQSTTGTLNFAPGVYVLAGGGLTINAGATVVANGVTFYNTTANSDSWGCGGSGGFSPISIAGSASVTMSAPTATDPIGLLFFQDRNVFDSRLNNIAGNSNSSYNGALYFKNSPLQFAGTSGNKGYMVLVADTMKINGTSNLGNDHTNLTNVYTLAPTTTGGGLVE
ncbi:MAG TPA: pilus assembly protein TadG-related protein [Bryobacteraceae bacterium]|nr:pilus assembly protein TadG-related protein [Bryobacteraceae bacterium]